MARYFPVAIKLDGRRYTGDWSLLQGGRICIRSAYGSHAAELTDERPEAIAARALEQIVRDYQLRRAVERERQEVEAQALAEQRRIREESLAEQLSGDDDPMRDALRRLVEQIEGSGYENEAGPLEMNAAFIEVRELLRGYVGR